MNNYTLSIVLCLFAIFSLEATAQQTGGWSHEITEEERAYVERVGYDAGDFSREDY